MIPAGSIGVEKLAPGSGPSFCVKHVYGAPNACTPGCCCNWQVPTGASRITWEIWGAGGNGNGSCNCSRCHHYSGASGGAYNIKTIQTAGGCQYSVCAGGVYRCCSRECNGCEGCASYVNGYNLSNFCAIGGGRGRSNTSWETGCYSDWECCIGPTSNNGDFGMGNHRGFWGGSIFCHCNWVNTCTTNAPFLAGGSGSYQGFVNCWIRCGCWYSPYGQGGQGAITSYCERCCGQGGTGGGGVVKITYT